MTAPGEIRWPDRFRPGRAPVHVRNEIDIPKPPERVWAWLVRAPEWPTWYPNAARVQVDGGAAALRLGATFRWRTFSANLSSRVEEFDMPSRLAWSARGFGVDVYHAWLLHETSGGTHVRTEESQYGVLARLDHWMRPRRMSQGHDLWLRSLRERTLSGPPPEQPPAASREPQEP